MTEERQARIDGAIADLLAQGLKVTKAAVFRVVGGNKPILSRYMDAWYLQHPEATAAVAVLEPPDAGPDEADASAQGPACRLTDGLPAPPARPTSSGEPRLMALDRERREAHVALEAAQRRVQETSMAWQEGKYTARQLTAYVHERSRVARSAPAHELAAALAAVDRARDALAAYVGGGEASRAAAQLGYMPAGLQ
jgi:hypothetical protein